jgi:hypothetical protein
MSLDVPGWWAPITHNQKEGGFKPAEYERRTKTVMMKERKKARVPDISYDLDQDGVVNNRDYFISKFFDAD